MPFFPFSWRLLPCGCCPVVVAFWPCYTEGCGLFVRALLACCIPPSALDSELAGRYLCLMVKLHMGVDPLLSLDSSSITQNAG